MGIELPSNRITADQLRQKFCFNLKEALQEAYGAILDAAQRGDRKVHLHGKFWATEGYRGSAEYKVASTQLRSDGYDVKFFYEDRQFADYYTIVTW